MFAHIFIIWISKLMQKLLIWTRPSLTQFTPFQLITCITENNNRINIMSMVDLLLHTWALSISVIRIFNIIIICAYFSHIHTHTHTYLFFIHPIYWHQKSLPQTVGPKLINVRYDSTKRNVMNWHVSMCVWMHKENELNDKLIFNH